MSTSYQTFLECITYSLFLYLIELVLSVLLESFIFSPGTQEIEWVMRGIAAPTTKNSLDAKRTMPLKVALVRDPSKI